VIWVTLLAAITAGKMLQGNWDAQFLVAEPGHKIAHKDFFE